MLTAAAALAPMMMHTTTAHADYTPVSGVLQVGPDEPLVVQVPLVSDQDGEKDESIAVELYDPVAATLVPAQAVARVNPATTVEEDQDFPLPTTPDPTRTDPGCRPSPAPRRTHSGSTAVVAADPTRAYPEGSVEAVLQAGLLTLPAEALREATSSAQAMVTADVDTRAAEFGQYGRNDWNTHARLGFAGAFQTDTLPVDRAALTARLTAQADQLAVEGRAAEQQVNEEADRLGVDPSTIKRVKTLALDITSVKCFETTSWEWFSDEIEMGGVVVGSDGATKKIKGYVQDAISKVIGGLLSVYFGPAIAGAIGKAVAFLVNAFIKWLIKLFGDTVFEPRHVNLKLPSNAAFMYDNPIYLGWDDYRSPTMSGYYERAGGKYRVDVNTKVLF